MSKQSLSINTKDNVNPTKLNSQIENSLVLMTAATVKSKASQELEQGTAMHL